MSETKEKAILHCNNCGHEGPIWEDFEESSPTCFTCKKCGHEDLLHHLLKD